MSAQTPVPVSETAYQRFRRLLPASHNPELIVLKGHLLVEAELERFLHAASRHPDQLNDARLSFVQKTCLVRAFGGWPPEDSLWLFIIQLNVLRNRLAHRLEPGDIGTQIDALLRIYWAEEFILPNSPRQRSTRLRQTLALVVAMMHGFTEGYAMTTSQRKSTLSV
jgi:hypothetical protein